MILVPSKRRRGCLRGFLKRSSISSITYLLSLITITTTYRRLWHIDGDGRRLGHLPLQHGIVLQNALNLLVDGGVEEGVELMGNRGLTFRRPPFKARNRRSPTLMAFNF